MLSDNPYADIAGFDKEAFRRRARALGLHARELTPEQREFARRERSRVCSQIAEAERAQREFARTQRLRPDFVLHLGGAR